jgi:hypothetical protein
MNKELLLVDRQSQIIPSKLEQAASQRTYCNSSVREKYVTGYGEVAQPVRAGAMQAKEIKSVGYRT